MSDQMVKAIDNILTQAGFTTERRQLPIPEFDAPADDTGTKIRLAESPSQKSELTLDILLAANPRLFAVIHWTDSWSEFSRLAEDLVTASAGLAEEIDRSARLWDLTVMVLARAPLTDSDRQSAVPWSTQTRYARRLLADAVDDISLTRKLAPLLPLDIAVRGDAGRNPMELVLDDLSSTVGPLIAQAAVHSFQQNGNVELP